MKMDFTAEACVEIFIKLGHGMNLNTKANQVLFENRSLSFPLRTPNIPGNLLLLHVIEKSIAIACIPIIAPW
jgi:hypothetical protein